MTLSVAAAAAARRKAEEDKRQRELEAAVEARKLKRPQAS